MEKSQIVILNGFIRQKIRELLGTVCIFLFAPFITIILILLYIYRRLIDIVLRIQLRKKFAGLLNGPDSIWVMENSVCLSVINILMILEKNEGDSNASFLENFRNLINDRIASRAAGTALEKLFYRRSWKFGYYFWERNEEVDLKDRIRWLECVNAECDGSCEDVTGEFFRKILKNVTNKPLPDDHTATWEILVGRRCSKFRSHVEESHLSPEECFNTNTRKIPVLFRIHHALGDGIALIDLLLKTIAEEEEEEMRIKVKSVASTNEIGKHFKETVLLNDSKRNFQNMEVVQSYEKDNLAASMPFTCVKFSRILRDHFQASLKFSNDATIESLKQQAKIWIGTWPNFRDISRVYSRIKKITQLTLTSLSLLKFLIPQVHCNTDETVLYGSSQTGEKLVSYWIENNGTDNKSQNFLTKVSEIRKHIGAKFEDVILAAFFTSIHKYYFRIDKPVPEALTVILPTKMAMPDKSITLDNKFSFAVLRICVSNANGQTITKSNRDSQFFQRLQDVTKVHNKVRNSSDILLNFWMMKYLLALLPMNILRASVLGHSTMVFSNLRGPPKIRILNNSLSNIVFWLPNRNTTALGLTLLSYGGNSHLSLMADKSIVENEKYFMELLENTVQEIDTAYNSIVL
ncbi:uncharacterized protein LOC105425846 [Pogonomyrmex barbatus]|uniref:Uncharacterized protein LOC105425846 n=1 Tax=Pogonomyrmex barbatus TaxID=144034 RepID=A0A6I9W0I7_9HYME|nr:uncharacterized protein LOC105425846 [Pogonomyrmex barbatus]XP_011635100.1 uncharacterized protein LOC105425846 [Pogonomyrmex barbatus]